MGNSNRKICNHNRNIFVKNRLIPDTPEIRLLFDALTINYHCLLTSEHIYVKTPKLININYIPNLWLIMVNDSSDLIFKRCKDIGKYTITYQGKNLITISVDLLKQFHQITYEMHYSKYTKNALQ